MTRILDDDLAALITQVRAQRQRLKLSAKSVAEKAGLTERYIFKMESLTVDPSVDTFMRYAAACSLRLVLEA